jgi:large subunit ribosomal protein L18
MRKNDSRTARNRRHTRVRMRVEGNAERPRVCVFRSLNHIYVQAIDDSVSHTVAAASTLDPAIRSELDNKGKVAAATLVGELLAKRMIQLGIKKVVFDRGGYKYHGRIKALAEAARKAGLEF